MATRSFIGLAQGNGVEYIYCHYDGNLSRVGATLLSSYNKLKKVEALMKLGDISSLDESLERTAQNAYNQGNKTSSIVVSLGEFYDYLFYNNCANIAYFYLFFENKWLFAEYGKDFKTLTKFKAGLSLKKEKQ